MPRDYDRFGHGMRGLFISVPNELYLEVKERAWRERKTLRQFVIDRLATPPEREPQPTAAGAGE